MEKKIDSTRVLQGAADTTDTEYLRYAKKKYGRTPQAGSTNSQRYRELMFGGYKPIEAYEVFKHFVEYVRPYKRYIALTAFGLLAAAMLESVRVLAIKFLIDAVLPRGANGVNLLALVCGGLIGIYLLINGIHLMCQYLIVFVGGYVVFDVRKRLFDHLQLLHIGFYEKEMSGKLITRLIHDVTALQQLISSGLTVLVHSAFSLMVNFVLMVFLSWKLTLFSIWVIPAYYCVTQYFRTRLYRKSMEVRERRSILAGSVTEVVMGAKVVKSFAMEDDERRRFSEMLRDNLGPEMDLGVYNTHRSVIISVITGIGTATIFFVGGLSYMKGGGISLGTFVAFTGFLSAVYNALMQVANLKMTLIEAQTGLERVLAVLEVDPQIKEKANPVELKDVEGFVEFRDARFAYAEGPEVLRGISLTAEPGQTVALVGPSGAGKSTIINLLTRFYDVKGGQILVDGHDLRDLRLKTYRSQIGIVLQDPFLFSGTIEDNIRYGRPEATPEEVIEAARQANALDFIEELPEGFQTLVGERGGMLSGGQRQRISIARALLKQPKILILDEATSSLDTESERLVQEAMDRLMKNRTVFVIAHRLTTVQNADKIVVLQRGKVVEEGTHDALLAQNGLYCRLYRGTKIQMIRKQRDREGQAVESATS